MPDSRTVEVIYHVQSGRKSNALCPWHQELTPSLVIDTEAGTFHCFGCNLDGTARQTASRTYELTPNDGK